MHADGFLYLVALLGVTGARGDLHPEALRLIRRVRSQTDLPLCVGFGISRPEHVRALSRAGADGAIVGSAIVERAAEGTAALRQFLATLSAALTQSAERARPA